MHRGARQGADPFSHSDPPSPRWLKEERWELGNGLEVADDLLASFERMVDLLHLACSRASAALVIADRAGRQRVVARAGRRVSAEALRPFCERLVGEMENEWLMVEDAERDPPPGGPGFPAREEPVRFFAGRSFRTACATVGFLCLADTHRRAIGESERRVLGHLVAGLETELALRRDASFDHLTGLHNRRYMEEVVEREWRRARREGTPVSALSIDIDHFKRLNDGYGHLQGDEALRAVARAMDASLLRPGDILARMGGEEFIAYLPQTDAEGARVAGEHVRRAVQELGIPNRGSSHRVVTVSVGCATAVPHCVANGHWLSLLQSADAALYEAKARGRNHVEMGNYKESPSL